ncbi:MULTISPECIES: LysR substrate-binding domain-containing protein [Roseomonadaceae]|uniref:LysR family transcriptional regulator n=1 Tax=Falsiroseomonas oleicola TaxID=2801474 RepID=A0ABS6HEU6_9PROT|nr:LysR substrate-binding domain-containing protein [Roseomonas oleicola]MBU8546203.1 LysR family transcriptional regulator [Roseomonas oleicola]
MTDMNQTARRLPPLAALRVFEAAGRLGSFVAAAAELGMTPSAVSKGVRTLEDRLGVPLFHRERHATSLTPAGESLLAEASRALDGLAQAVARISGARGQDGLRVSAAPTFAGRWLLPRLGALRRAHPALSVAISTERDWVELGDGRFDFAIRMAPAPVGGGEWLRLSRLRLVPVAAPSRAGTPLAQLLRRLPAIHVVTVREDWASWGARHGMAAPDPARGLRLDTLHMAVDAAAQGLGVALARLPVCEADLREGRVVALAPPIEIDTWYWLVARPGILRQTEGRLFAAWLAGELAEPAGSSVTA